MSEELSTEGSGELLEGGADNAAQSTEAKDATSSAVTSDSSDYQADTTTSSEPADWRVEFRDGLDDKTAESWDNISGRFTNKADLAKKLVNQETAIRSRIPLPKEDASEEEWNEVYDKMGRPEKPDGYQFNWPNEAAPLSEPEKAASSEFLNLSHRIGLNQKQVDAIVQWDAKTRGVISDAERARVETNMSERMSALRVEWGQDFDANKNHYSNSAKHYMGGDFEEYRSLRLDDGTMLSNHPVMARAWARVGRDRVNDDWEMTPMNQQRKQDAQSELRSLQDEILEKRLRPGMPGYPQEKLDELYKAVGSTRKRSPNDKFAR